MKIEHRKKQIQELLDIYQHVKYHEDTMIILLQEIEALKEAIEGALKYEGTLDDCKEELSKKLHYALGLSYADYKELGYQRDQRVVLKKQFIDENVTDKEIKKLKNTLKELDGKHICPMCKHEDTDKDVWYKAPEMFHQCESCGKINTLFEWRGIEP